MKRYTIAGLMLLILFVASHFALATTVPITLFAKPAALLNCSQVATPALWFDASGLVTTGTNSYGTTSGGAISQWNDLSGNANNATQATSALKPTVQTSAQNGLSGLRIASASSQVMALTSTVNFDSAYTIAAVVRRGGPTGTNTVEVFGAAASNPFMIEWYSDTILYSGNSSGFEVAVAESSTGYNVVIATITGTTGSIYYNGTDISNHFAVVGNYSVAAIAKIGFGDGSFMNGEIGEICAYTSVLSGTQVSQLQAGLKAKWATP